jgi:hypothetical protein
MNAIDPQQTVGGAAATIAEPPGSGWMFFAASALGLAGVMRLIDAIWAFNYSGDLPNHLKGGLLGSSVDAYAWLWLVAGVVMLAASVLLLVRSQLARVIGFLAAFVGGVSAMAWMPYYPVWSLMYVAIAVLVIYALVRYGGREYA